VWNVAAEGETTVRMLLKMTVPVDRGNATIRDGSMQKVIEATVNQLKPEATYFYPADGQRTALIIFNLEKESDIVATVEPLWLGMEADIELVPVMNLDDLMAGFQSMPR
jgi:hypothetical protein